MASHNAIFLGMRKLILALTAVGAVITACSDAGGVDPDAIDGPELAAVRRSLDSALTNDTLYPTLAAVVFPFIDRASRIPTGNDTTRVVAIELDIDATTVNGPVVANFTAILGWRGYRPASHTVDSVFFLLGAGRAPTDDSLQTMWSPDSAGTGTGFVIHQATDSTRTIWLARGGHLRTTTATYGAGRAVTVGITLFRGMVSGDFAITAKLVPDSTTTVTALKDFGGGARALKVRIRDS